MSHDVGVPGSGTPYPSNPSETSIDYIDLPASGQESSSSSTPGVAKEQAAGVAQNAAEAGRRVGGTAAEQASNVAGEASQQAKNLLGQTTSELQQQAAQAQQRVAAGIRSLGEELASMADRSEQSGTATDVVRQASQRADALAGWLDDRDPGSLVQEVTDFARRRPGAFLAIAAGAGLLAGRLTRGTIAAAKDSHSDSGSTSGSIGTGGSTAGAAVTTPPAYAAVPPTSPVPVYGSDPALVEPYEPLPVDETDPYVTSPSGTSVAPDVTNPAQRWEGRDRS